MKRGGREGGSGEGRKGGREGVEREEGREGGSGEGRKGGSGEGREGGSERGSGEGREGGREGVKRGEEEKEREEIVTHVTAAYVYHGNNDTTAVNDIQLP